MPTLRVVSQCSVSGNEVPVPSEIYSLSIKRGKRRKTHLGRTNSHGFFKLKKIPHALLVHPCECHWSQIVKRADISDTCTVLLSKYNRTDWWWNAPPQLSNVVSNPKIGILDIGFPRNLTDQLQNFQDIHGWPLESPQAALPREDFGAYHGFVVSRIIASKPMGGFAGVATGSDVYFANIGVDGKSGRFGYEVDPYKLMAALDYLVRKVGVNIINISSGFEWDANDFKGAAQIERLEEHLKYALSRGVICVCSAGNNPKTSLVHPARSTATASVSGLGPAGVAPVGSYVYDSEQTALGLGKVSSVSTPKFTPFLDPHCSRGEGLDYVAPSIGISIPFPAGSLLPAEQVFFEEFDGTSFSAPVVVGALACVISRDHLYWESSGLGRSRRAVQCLDLVCNSLGFAKDEVGSGFPCL